MQSNTLNTVMVVIGLGTLSLIARFVIFAYFFGPPINAINAHMKQQFATVQHAMEQASRSEDYSNRDAFRTDAEWEAATFARGGGHRRASSDNADDTSPKTDIPVVPPSSWVVFASTGSAGERIMHARLALADADGKPFLTIEFTQPALANGDTGGAAQIAFATVSETSCASADALVMRFDDARPVRYKIKAAWADTACRVDVPDFPHFRAAMINATTLYVRLAKGDALTQEIPAPVAGLSWPP